MAKSKKTTKQKQPKKKTSKRRQKSDKASTQTNQPFEQDSKAPHWTIWGSRRTAFMK